MRCLPALLVATGLASVALVGCGDGDEAAGPKTTLPVPSTSETFTFADWQEQITEVCAEFEPQQDAIVERLGPPSSADEAVALFEELEPVADAYVVEFLAVPKPIERRDEIQRVYDLAQMNVRAGDDVLSAALAGDDAALRAAVNQLSVQSQELSARLKDLDVPACG